RFWAIANVLSAKFAREVRSSDPGKSRRSMSSPYPARFQGVKHRKKGHEVVLPPTPTRARGPRDPGGAFDESISPIPAVHAPALRRRLLRPYPRTGRPRESPRKSVLQW